MLTQQEADALIEILKSINSPDVTFPFPNPGECKKIELDSADGKCSFVVDVNRKGCINLSSKCTFQGRYQKDTPLIRLDVNGPEHTNPDGETMPGTHLHIYREGFGDRFAFPIPREITNVSDLFRTLTDFLIYFKTSNADSLEIEMVL